MEPDRSHHHQARTEGRSSMGNEADDAAAQTPDRPPAARGAIAEAQPYEPAAGHVVPAERFSLLAELAEDPANGLQEIEPGVYVCRKDRAVPIGRATSGQQLLQPLLR